MNALVTERDGRWSRVRELLHREALDAVLAVGDFGSIQAHQRYLSGHRAIFEVEVAMLFADGSSELVVAHPGVGALSGGLSWIDSEPVLPDVPRRWPADEALDAPPSLAGQLANQLGRRGCKRVGVAGLAEFPGSWIKTIEACIPGVEFVELESALRHLRLAKSPYEVDLIRTAAKASDEAWSALGDIVRPGRRYFEALADIEHILRLNGCEDSYNLFLRLPMDPTELDQYPQSSQVISEDDVFCVEVSPRYQGYFAQQSGMVSFGPARRELQEAYDTLNRARDVGLELMKPGADLAAITDAANAVLVDAGMTPVPFFTGHFVGLELEDKRTGEGSVTLQEHMTLVFHPIAMEFPAVMRADTYVITGSGVERITTGSELAVQL